jgi:rhodanese-related sulfurtransferase
VERNLVLAPKQRYEPIEGEELYRRLATGKPVVILDVRTETEFVSRHIPGSLLIPLHELESRLAEVPNSGTPITVICQKGFRSMSACHLLSEYGYGPMYNLEGGLDRWPGPILRGTNNNGQHTRRICPASFLVNNFDLLPKGLALDVAMGEGRNALYLATRGFDVDGVDVDADTVASARAAARKLGAPIRAIVGNFEDGTYIIPIDTYDVITVFNYLHRPLFKDIKDGVVPGGVVVYQTFTEDQAKYGPPTDPKHLLRRGELREVFSDWEILNYRELIGPARGTRKMRALAGIVARKPLPVPID